MPAGEGRVRAELALTEARTADLRSCLEAIANDGWDAIEAIRDYAEDAIARDDKAIEERAGSAPRSRVRRERDVEQSCSTNQLEQFALEAYPPSRCKMAREILSLRDRVAAIHDAETDTDPDPNDSRDRGER